MKKWSEDATLGFVWLAIFFAAGVGIVTKNLGWGLIGFVAFIIGLGFLMGDGDD